MQRLSRRTFLKLLGLSSSVFLFPQLALLAQRELELENPARPNIIVLVLDAMSAKNLSLYGYPRETTPQLQRFASRATVYHSHYSGGNFTTSGTASLLTGTYPWTHRAINIRGVMRANMPGNDIFSVLGKEYTRLAFTQNTWANFIVTQLQESIDVLLPPGSFSELNMLVSGFFPNDANMALRALDDFVFKGGGQPATLLFNPLQRGLYVAKRERLPSNGYFKSLPYQLDYPVHFRIETVFDGLLSVLQGLQNPFFAYLHLLPPHEPYVPTDRFANKFKDKLSAAFPVKPAHVLSDNRPNDELLKKRRLYDEYVASTDYEVGRFLDALHANGLYDTSYIFITTDHGEMFERGELGHVTALLHEPVTHVPLLVSVPGQTTRRDVYTPTSAVDLLPTIARIAGKDIPAQVEGNPLPGIEAASEEPVRGVYTVEGKLNTAYYPFKDASFLFRKGNQKLTYYKGYNLGEAFEFYDLDEDPEELNDLYPQTPADAIKMKDELLEAILKADKPYMSNRP